MSISKLFTEHPAAVGESYFGHLLAASSFGFRMMFAGLACLAHAVLPFIFVDTGSRAVAASRAPDGPAHSRQGARAPAAR